MNNINENNENNFINLKSKFISYYNNSNNLYYFLSPGRIELLGNHTDHNNGNVLTSSIDLYIYACVSKNTNNIIRINSENHKLIEIDLNEFSKNIDNDKYINSIKNNGSISMVYGILYKFIKLGFNVGGFDSYTISDLPLSAGVSSSASFENLICKILSYLYNDDKVTSLEIATISKYAENEFFGKPCGLLDQCAISFGGINYIDFKNPNNPIIKSINDIKISDDFCFVLINTGNHSKLTSYYASIKNDMNNISSFFNKNVLREADKQNVIDNKNVLIDKFGLKAFNRSIHFFNENDRVEQAYNYLVNSINYNDDKRLTFERLFLDCIKNSGISSYELLGNCYCESEDEELPKGIKYCKELDCEAYVRVHGGGFAGTILMVIDKNNLDYDINLLNEHFGKENVKKVNLSKYGTMVWNL